MEEEGEKEWGTKKGRGRREHRAKRESGGTLGGWDRDRKDQRKEFNSSFKMMMRSLNEQL